MWILVWVLQNSILAPAGSFMTASAPKNAPSWTYRLPWKLIARKADKHNVDRNLVAAIIQTESSGHTCRLRYEKHFVHLYRPGEFSERLAITSEAEIEHQKTSFGLMQVMGSVAREMGFKRHLYSLCEPSINVELGIRKLKSLKAKYTTQEDIISAYNSGTPFRSIRGVYRNQNYVNKVLKNYNAILQGTTQSTLMASLSK